MSGAGSQSPSSVQTTKITRGHSCILCQQRKVKCDRQKPCSNCIKARVECIPSPPAPPRRRRKQNPELELAARLRRCEELLKSHGVKIEGDLNNDGPNRDSIDAEDTPNHQIPSESCRESGKLILDRGDQRYLENQLWTGLSDELQDSKIQPGSSEDEVELDSYPDEGNFLFGRSTSASMSSLHPQPVQIFRLWQTFLDNVNPLVKLFHAPTVQSMVLDASGNLDKIPKNTEALMFVIYLVAVTSMANEECESMLGETRSALLTRYSRATQQALINASFLKSSNLVVLQAFTLFLLSVRQCYDPHSLWILTGVAARIGQRLGLHRDGAYLDISLFEAEMRRRLWWQIAILDSHAAKLSGAQVSRMIRESDTKIPLNVNDSDLNPNMKELPVEHTGTTEMVFCLTRYEVGHFLRNMRTNMKACGDDVKGFHHEWEGLSDTFALIKEKDKAIDEFENYLERKYLRFCDPSIPIHGLAAAVARSVVCMMRLMAHHPRQYADKGASMSQEEKDMLFNTSMKMIEYHLESHTTKSVRGFLWYINVHFALDAFIYMLSELRHRISGELVDRAWQLINQVFEYHPEMISDIKNSLYAAVGNLTIKAWDKRAMAGGYHQGPYRLEPPHYITTLRSQRKMAQQAQTTNEHDNIASIPVDEINRGPQMANSYLGDEWGNTGNSSDSTLVPDMSPMDWEYWQNLLEGSEMPAVDYNGQQLFFQGY